MFGTGIDECLTQTLSYVISISFYRVPLFDPRCLGMEQCAAGIDRLDRRPMEVNKHVMVSGILKRVQAVV